MPAPTAQKPVLFRCALRKAILGLFALLVSVGLLSTVLPARTSAAVSNTINFQARLQSSGGAIAPDGNYNVEFKLYDALTSGTLLWTEDHLNNTATQVHVVNGYLTVNLGSVTAFGTLNWNQQMWLTMNVGNTANCTPFASCVPDGEMSPRIQLTAVPYAFQAGELGNGTNKATLDSSGNLTLQQASTFSTNTGNLTVQAASALALQTAAGGTSSNVTIQSGNASSGASGNISIDNGTFTSGTPTISVGTTSARSISVGNTTAATTLSLQGGTGASAVGVQSGASGTISVGTTAQAGTVTIGDTATVNTGNTQTVNVGNLNVAGTTNVNIGSTTNATAGTTAITGKTAVNITGFGASTWQTSAAALTITGGTTLALQTAAGVTSSGVTLQTGNASAGVSGNITIDNGTFTSGTPAITVGTTSSRSVSVGNTTAATTLLLQGGTGGSAAALQVGSGGTLGIGNNAVAQVLQIGNNQAATTLTVEAGTGTTTLFNGNTAHTIQLGTGGTSTVQAITIGSATNTTSTLTLQGGNGASAISLLTGNNTTTTAGGIQIGNTTGAFTQAINIGNNTTGSSTTNVLIGSTVAGTVTLQPAGGVVLGVATSQNGKLIFNSATGSSFTTTILASSSQAATYNLILPLTGPGTSQCLQTDSVTASQLKFAACSGGGGGVTLQGSSPGTADVGNFNVNGNGQVGGKFGIGFTGVAPTAALDVTAPTSTVGFNLQGTALGITGSFTGAAASNILTVLGVAGQATSAGNGIGGAGGPISLTTGTGGAATDNTISDTPLGGDGGNLTIATGTGGQGGAGSASGQGGNGGTINIAAGNGGAGVSGLNGISGNGGSINITAGSTSATGSNGGTGGNILLQGGASTQSGQSGSVTVQSNTQNSIAAFQVQTAGAQSVFTVSTVGNISNLVNNPSIESAIVGNWTAWNNGGAGASAAQTSTPYIGSNALSIGSGSAANGGVSQTLNATTVAGFSYNVTFYAKANAAAVSPPIVRAAFSQDATLADDVVCSNTLTLDYRTWRRYSCTFIAAGTITNGNAIMIEATTASQSFFIDAVLVQLTSSAESNYKEGSISLQGPVTSPLILQSSTNVSTALQVLNKDGGAVLTVDTGDYNNFVTNPSFELNIANWTAVGTGSIARDTSQSNFGVASLKVITQAAINTGARYTLPSLTTGTYTISFSMLTTGTDHSFIQVGYKDASTDHFATCAAAALSPAANSNQVANVWIRYACANVSLTTPSSLLITSSSASSKTYYIDGVQLESGATATSYALGAVTMSASLSVPTITLTGSYGADPTCTPGAIYYNTGANTGSAVSGGDQFRACRRNTAGTATWYNLIAGVDVQDFAASGTWTKPTGVTMLLVVVCGGGGGGGAGVGAAAGNARPGGTGGGGGAHAEALISAVEAGASQAVTVGGTAGAGITGNQSKFGSLVQADGGGAGAGGSSLSAESGGSGGGFGQNGVTGAAGSIAGGDNNVVGTVGSGGAGGGGVQGAAGKPAESGGGGGAGSGTTGTVGFAGGDSLWGGGAGGSGGGVTSGNVGAAGGNGGGTGTYGTGFGGSGGATNNNGTGGTSPAAGSFGKCAPGGGGGGGNTTVTGNTGGAGGTPGGGGGGGGGGVTTGGTGGQGARGEVWVISW